MNFIKLLLVGVIILAAFGFVVFQVLQFFFSIQVSTSKLKKDMEDLKLKVSNMNLELVKLDKETLPLLSFGKEEDFVKEKMYVFKEGLFTSIYHEPLMAYAYKKYIARVDKSILLVKTKNNSYEYFISEKSTKVLKDGTPYGVIYSDGTLKNSKNEALASIDVTERSLLPIMINDKSVAMLNNPSNISSGLARAFELIDIENNEEEEAILVLSTLLAVQAEG